MTLFELTFILLCSLKMEKNTRLFPKKSVLDESSSGLGTIDISELEHLWPSKLTGERQSRL